MKVTSSKTISFPQYRWGINAGEERELPSDKKAAETILAHKDIKEVGKSESSTSRAKSSGTKKSDK